MGGFGEVWKASHQSRPNLPPVALKFCIDETAAPTLRKEVELLDRVTRQGRHRGIVELRYAHLEGNTPCLEYEYVDGGDLACLVIDLHRVGKATALNMTRLFFSLVQAVGFAHRIQPPIVHRDLKPWYEWGHFYFGLTRLFPWHCLCLPALVPCKGKGEPS